MKRTPWIVALLALAGLGSDAASPPASLRAYIVQSASFDYVFTSATVGSDGCPVLGFNHRSGRTLFAKPGEHVDEYVLEAYQPETNRVFNPTINSYQERKSGRATLRAPDGRTFVLVQGERLQEPGRMTCLVSLDSGEWWPLKEGDTFTAQGESIAVEAISEKAVSVVHAGQRRAIPLISEEEKAALNGLWRARQEAEKRRLLTLKRRQEQERPPITYEGPSPAGRRQSVDIAYPARISFGTEFRYPAEFEVFPAILDAATGRVIQPAFAVPTSFKTRTTGVSLEYR